MPDRSRRFDSYIPQINSDKLKKMVRTYGGDYKMRKQECIDFLLAALNDPETIAKAIENLEPFEQLSLALLKQMGGAADFKALGIGVLASGIEITAHMRRSDFLDGLATHLVEHGLVLNEGYSVGSFYAGYQNVRLYSDPRLLALVGPPRIPASKAATAALPTVTTVRMPPTVALELIGFLQTLDSMGGLGLTKAGTLRVNDLRKFQKALQWPQDDLEINGLLFPDATNALIHALRHSDFLELAYDTLVLKTPVETIAEQPYEKQVATLVNGFLSTSEWVEMQTGYGSYRNTNYPYMRAALFTALASLRIDTEDFYAINTLDELLFDRIGETFTLEGPVRKYLHTYGKNPAEVRQLEVEWQVKQRNEWLLRERIWLETALSSWLYFLGIVELGMEGKRPISFRLTPLGKAVLHPAKALTVRTAANEEQGAAGAWVVQPNFDVMVYLDRTTPPQLAFLERHAERTQSQQYMAHYHLTRESVYRGLESGTTLDEVLAELAEHAQTPLPQNVQVEIREWAALREQVILHHRGQLLEFADSAARDAALATELACTSVGDRFLLLAPVEAPRKRFPNPIGAVDRVNYAAPLPQILQADETGALQLKTDPIDLLLKPQLDQWAERGDAGQWQLTPAGVYNTIKTGARISELLALLTARLSHKLPPLLELTLRHWAGRKAKTVALERFVVLRYPDETVLQAIHTSKRLKPYLRGILQDENLILFDPTRLDEIKEILGWAGVEITTLQVY